MSISSLSPFDPLADVFKALAHPVRLFLVQQVADGEKCVCELVAMLDLDTSTVSKHLAVLKKAGVVVDEKRGNMVFYRLRMRCVLGFFSCIRKDVEDQAREKLATVAG